MIFIGVHVLVLAITLWLVLHRYLFNKNEYWFYVMYIFGIHILLCSIYFWYFHMHDDGYRFYKWLLKMIGIYNEYNM